MSCSGLKAGFFALAQMPDFGAGSFGCLLETLMSKKLQNILDMELNMELICGEQSMNFVILRALEDVLVLVRCRGCRGRHIDLRMPYWLTMGTKCN